MLRKENYEIFKKSDESCYSEAGHRTSYSLYIPTAAYVLYELQRCGCHT